MMDARIISKVSEIILEKRTGQKVAAPKGNSGTRNDSVQLSSNAIEAQKVAKAIENGDNERAARVQELRSAVQKKEFQLTDEMVERIAQNIAAIFI